MTELGGNLVERVDVDVTGVWQAFGNQYRRATMAERMKNHIRVPGGVLEQLRQRQAHRASSIYLVSVVWGAKHKIHILRAFCASALDPPGECVSSLIVQRDDPDRGAGFGFAIALEWGNFYLAVAGNNIP